jgi:hypothetical protein
MVLGSWLVEGNPTVVLFDIGSAAWEMAAWKQQLYEKTQIGEFWSDSVSSNFTRGLYLGRWGFEKTHIGEFFGL